MEHYYSPYTGLMHPKVFVAAMLFAVFGFILHKLNSLRIRDKKSNRTPEKLSIKFWLIDNRLDIIHNVIMIIIGVRFAPDIIGLLVMIKILPDWVTNFFNAADHMAIYVAVGWISAYRIEKINKLKKIKLTAGE